MNSRIRGSQRFVYVGLLFAGAALYHAEAGLEFQQTAHYVQQPDERQSSELWLAAESITVRGQMQQSFFGLAESAELSGRFSEDVWVTAKDIAFDGGVDENARLSARNSVVLLGKVGGNLMAAAARSVQLDEEATIGQDALLAAPNVILRGRVEGRATVWARRAIIAGRIDGDLRIRAEEITILPGSHIGGDLVYSAPRELVLGQRIHVGGAIERSESPAGGFSGGQHIMVQLFLFTGALFTGLIFTAAFPRYTGHTVRRIRRSFWLSAITGGVAFFLLPAAAALAVFTIVGIPAGALIAGVYTILLYLAKIVVALAVGGTILQRRGPQPYFTAALTLTVGLLLLYFIAGLPIVGPIGTIIILLIGLGGLILGLKDVQYGQRPPSQRDAQPMTRDTLSQEQ